MSRIFTFFMPSLAFMCTLTLQTSDSYFHKKLGLDPSTFYDVRRLLGCGMLTEINFEIYA